MATLMDFITAPAQPSVVIADPTAPSTYFDRTFPGTRAEWFATVASSTTLYIGNLAFFTTEAQLHELFSKCGEVKRIVMGLDRKEYTPCGFCFVEYYSREAALDCLRYVVQTKLDDRFIRVDIDPGFREGRQFGRGHHGGQVRDAVRADFDPDRGGWGASAITVNLSSSYRNQYDSMQETLGTKRKSRNDSIDDDEDQPERRYQRTR